MRCHKKLSEDQTSELSGFDIRSPLDLAMSQSLWSEETNVRSGNGIFNATANWMLSTAFIYLFSIRVSALMMS